MGLSYVVPVGTSLDGCQCASGYDAGQLKKYCSGERKVTVGCGYTCLSPYVDSY